MKNTLVTENPVVLEGYQAILKPSKFGYSLSAHVNQDLVDKLEVDRVDALKWAESKLKNPKRSVLKPEPWEEVEDGVFKIKFSWNEDMKPPIVDSEGTPITDERTPLYSGSKVKLAFYQRPYILKDATTYGTSLKIQAIQVIEVNSSGGGSDKGDLSFDDAVSLFGVQKGFKQSMSNVKPDFSNLSYDKENDEEVEAQDDF